VEIPAKLLLLYLALVQVPSAMNYESGVQESQEQITPIGVAFNTGCARTDVAVYIPLLAAGLIGCGGGRHGHGGQRKEWGRVCRYDTLLHSLDVVFIPLEATDSPHRQEPASVKKRKKGNARWATRHIILGWLVDTVHLTIDLPVSSASWPSSSRSPQTRSVSR
jgi:hypothetical protein